MSEQEKKPADDWLPYDSTAGGAATAPASSSPEKPPGDLLGYGLHDTGNADRLVHLYGDRMRWCKEFKKWLIWNGCCWAVEHGGGAEVLAEKAMLAFREQTIGGKKKGPRIFATLSLNAGKLDALLRRARNKLEISASELDRSSTSLNFLNGTLHLPTGVLWEHSRTDWLTKVLPFNYNPMESCNLWRQFVRKIMGGNEELIDYLQRALGYAITGDVSEKVSFLLHGAGNNGKTTLLAVVRDLIAPYTATVDLDLLISKQNDNNVQAARALLAGARFAVSSEPEQGQTFSASRFKRINQGSGGMITACRKYENPFSFHESHKLIIDANHLPRFPSNDQAVWDRLRLIPCLVTIPPEEQDRELKEKLLFEEPEGILAWLAIGAQTWYAKGLGRCGMILSATEKWRADVDQVGNFIEDAMTIDAQASIAKKIFYEKYRSWCEANGERYMSKKTLSQEMTSLKYSGKHGNRGDLWLGLEAKSEGEASEVS